MEELICSKKLPFDWVPETVLVLLAKTGPANPLCSKSWPKILLLIPVLYPRKKKFEWVSCVKTSILNKGEPFLKKHTKLLRILKLWRKNWKKLIINWSPEPIMKVTNTAKSLKIYLIIRIVLNYWEVIIMLVIPRKFFLDWVLSAKFLTIKLKLFPVVGECVSN